MKKLKTLDTNDIEQTRRGLDRIIKAMAEAGYQLDQVEALLVWNALSQDRLAGLVRLPADDVDLISEVRRLTVVDLDADEAAPPAAVPADAVTFTVEVLDAPSRFCAERTLRPGEELNITDTFGICWRLWVGTEADKPTTSIAFYTDAFATHKKRAAVITKESTP